MDARVRYTKMVIQEQFVTLLRELPLNKITVKRICQEAQLNRATFYKHYADPYDLLEQMEQSLLQELEELILPDRPDNSDALICLLEKMRENYPLYSTLFSDHGDPSFPSKVFRLAYRLKAPELFSTLPQLSPERREWLYYFLAQGCSGILSRWTRDGMKEEPEEVAAFIGQLCDTVLAAVCLSPDLSSN